MHKLDILFPTLDARGSSCNLKTITSRFMSSEEHLMISSQAVHVKPGFVLSKLIRLWNTLLLLKVIQI